MRCTLVFLLSGFISFSQFSENDPSQELFPEKIYIQLSSKELTVNQNIWFKAIVTDARNHLPTHRSGVLYVDLIDSNSEVVAHKIIKLTNGIGQGSFDLLPSFSGQYLIRAYTEWNRNFGPDFMFEQEVTIYKLAIQKDEGLFEELQFFQNQEGQTFLKGQVKFDDDSKTNNRKVRVFLDWGTGKDTTQLIRKGQEKYVFDHEVPNNLTWISLKTKDNFGRYFLKTLILKDSIINVQFFPESGKMVNGIKNKIGFKAVGFDGKGREIHGDIFDNTGKRMTPFESNSLGMGFFYMKPERNRSYYAKLTSATNIKTSKIFQLPKPVEKGSTLSVWKTMNHIRFRATSTNQTDSVAIKISCRGVDYFLIEGLLENGKLISEIPFDNIPEGIIVFTLLDKNNQPIAERLYYNEYGVYDLRVELTTDKSNYNRREKTKLDIQVLQTANQPTTSNMSVKVINTNQWRKGMDGFIQSHFYLESELKGTIENPGNYFDRTNASRLKDLEALLLTQGWRNYKFPAKRQGNHFFWPQPGLMVKGKVNNPSVENKKEKVVDLTLATFGNETSLYTQRTDTLGNFQFLLEDDFGEPMRIVLRANDSEKRRKKLSIKINDLGTPKVKYKHNPFARKMDVITTTLLEEEQRRKRTAMVFDSLYGVTQLDEVIVEDVRLNPERQKIYQRHGNPDVVISGDSLVRKEEKWSFGLYSVLMFHYSDEVIVEQFPDGFMLAHIRGESTLLMVDGRLLRKEEYGLVARMPPSIIEDIELIKFAKSYRRTYLEAFPEANPLTAPYIGHIISINTKGKAGIHATVKPRPGTLDTSIHVFSPIKEFYTPKYDKAIPVDEQKPDLRSLIHWSPILNTDEDGKLSESFYNGDVPGEFVIIVEAISDDGHIGYQTKTFTVE